MLLDLLENTTPNSAYKAIERLCGTYTSICKLVKKIEEQEGFVILSIFFYKLIDIMDALFLILSSFMSRGTHIINVICLISYDIDLIIKKILVCLKTLLVAVLSQCHSD